MLSDKGYRWAMVGLAALGSVAGGVLMGQSASAEMAPFYANLTTTSGDPYVNKVQVVDGNGDSQWIKTDAFDYPQPVVGDAGDSRY